MVLRRLTRNEGPNYSRSKGRGRGYHQRGEHSYETSTTQVIAATTRQKVPRVL